MDNYGANLAREVVAMNRLPVATARLPVAADFRGSNVSLGNSSDLGKLQVRHQFVYRQESFAPVPDEFQSAVSLAAYYMGRAMLGYPIDDPILLTRMRRMNQSMDAIRNALRYGRGNVRIDNEISGGDSVHRTDSARLITGKTVQEVDDKLAGLMIEASAALMFGAGNCGEHSSTLLLEHASRMISGEIVELQSVNVDVDLSRDHALVSSRMENHPIDDFDQIIHGDAWKNGPPVLRVDAPISISEPFVSIGSDAAPTVRAAFQNVNYQMQQAHATNVEQILQQQRQQPVNLNEMHLRPPPSIDPEFAQSVRDALAVTDPEELLEEALQCGTDAGLTRQQAQLYSAHIMAQANRLDEIRLNRVRTTNSEC
jgi:hypothetical protein